MVTPEYTTGFDCNRYYTIASRSCLNEESKLIAKPKPRKKSRVEKSEEAREALLLSAAKCVGQFGYNETSIARITQGAGLAQGTFYNYFESRQDIFDELLPILGAKMLEHIRQRVRGKSSFIEREEASFVAFFDFLKRMPYFLRILNEAEFFAPKAHKRHFNFITQGYIRFLEKASDAGEISKMTKGEIEAAVYILIAARSYLAMRYAKRGGAIDLPPEAVATYMRLVKEGLFGRNRWPAASSITTTNSH